MSDSGYINYFELLGIGPEAKPGEVRNSYKKLMKGLVGDIAHTQITPERRDRFLLNMAQLNAAFYILRDKERRARYEADRARVIEAEAKWREADAQGGNTEETRRNYDSALKHFLSTYMEELILEAGRDPECVEASHWDPSHERHAGRVLRHYRQRQYNEIHERLPFYDITKPVIDWDERARTVAALAELKGS